MIMKNLFSSHFNIVLTLSWPVILLTHTRVHTRIIYI